MSFVGLHKLLCSSGWPGPGYSPPRPRRAGSPGHRSRPWTRGSSGSCWTLSSFERVHRNWTHLSYEFLSIRFTATWFFSSTIFFQKKTLDLDLDFVLVTFYFISLRFFLVQSLCFVFFQPDSDSNWVARVTSSSTALTRAWLIMRRQTLPARQKTERHLAKCSWPLSWLFSFYTLVSFVITRRIGA